MSLLGTIGPIQLVMQLELMGGATRGSLSVIELLAVIANITILRKMLLPTRTTANMREYRIGCLPDFKPFGLALTLRSDGSESHISP